MTTDNPKSAPRLKPFMRHPYLLGLLASVICLGLGATYLYYWHAPELRAIFLQDAERVLPLVAQTLPPRPSSSSPEKLAVSPDLPQPIAQELHDKVTMAATPATQMEALLSKLSNQLVLVQAWLVNQQFSTALNLLNTFTTEVAGLPPTVKNSLHAIIEMDRANIQQAYEVTSQLNLELQQLEYYVNQQLLLRFAHNGSSVVAVSGTDTLQRADSKTPWIVVVGNKITALLSQGMQVRYKNQTATSSEPNFYAAIMLQMALQRAQLALVQGNWTECQFRLSILQTWMTADLLAWLPELPDRIRKITALAAQPSPLAKANVSATQARINDLL